MNERMSRQESSGGPGALSSALPHSLQLRAGTEPRTTGHETGRSPPVPTLPPSAPISSAAGPGEWAGQFPPRAPWPPPPTPPPPPAPATQSWLPALPTPL